MRITIDYTSGIAQGAGIGRYTRNLVAALAALPTGDHFTLFSTEPSTPERGFPTAPNMTPRVFPLGARRMTILWQRLRLPLPVELLAGSADVLHAPDFSVPPALRTPRVVTIHDLAFMTNPECALPSLVTYLNGVVPRAVRASDAIIAVSQRTADDLVERLAVPREKITVIHLGVDAAISAQADPAAVARLRERHGLEPPVTLAVGTLEPRKNYPRLIEAFAQATREEGGPRTLAIVGRRGWLYDDIFAAVERSGVAERIRLLEGIGDDELALLYHAADALAQVSIYEGFGIPLLEAMASGLPSVAANAGSLPEVAGDAALLVDPYDPQAICAALLRVTREPELRASLVGRGLRRARDFSWQTAARAHLDLYHRVAKRA